MSVLVTGGSGFIGRNVIKTLIAEGNNVIAFNRRKIVDFIDKKNFKWVQGNLSTGEGLQNVPWKELDSVIHLAAAGVKASKREWAESIQVNIIGTQRLLLFIEKYAVKLPNVFIAKTFYEKLINDIPEFRTNPYIATKEASSSLTELWSEGFRGATIFGTIYHTFGPDDDPSSVLSYAAKQFKSKKPAVFSSGIACGDWLYIDDTVSGILKAIKEAKQDVNHWDIGSGNLHTVRDLVEQLMLLSGRNKDDVVFDPLLDRVDVSLRESAKKLPPGFIPKFTITQGLEELYKLI